MNFEQLKQFICIVENKTYLEAAEIFHISQSALSKSVIRLEKELDTKLFDRTGRNVELTDDGKVFYQDAKILIDQYHQALNHLKPNQKEKLVLATLPIINQYDLNTMLKKLQTHYQLIINECEEHQLQDIINHKNCDLAIARENSIDHKNYQITKIASDELVVLMSKHHSLANKKRIDFKDLKNELFLCMPKHTYVHQLFINLCKEYQFEPNIIMNARVESLISSLQENQGISLLMKRSLDVFKHPNIIYKSLTIPVTSNIILIYKKSYQDFIKSIAVIC